MATVANRMTAWAAPVLRAPSRVGWIVLSIGILAWIAGALLGWAELLVVAAAAFCALVVAVAFTVRRTQVRVALGLDRQRVVVGETTTASIEVGNPSSRRKLPVRIEAPVGEGVARWDVPSLPARGSWQDVAVIRTSRRSVISVGPARSVRDDPLGLARREVLWADPLELFVHPRTVRLDGLTAGWMRDVDGQTTNDLSTSDVAFHTLREYVPGDDRRHVHWRTSARLGTLMVRQFVDTRRSHLGLLLSTREADYADPEELELAISVMGSLGRSALFEGQAVSAIAGGKQLGAASPQLLLDGLSAILPTVSPTAPTDLVQRSLPLLRGVSVGVLLVGSTPSRADVRAAAERFPFQVAVLVVRCTTEPVVTMRTIGRVSILELGRLEDLSRVLRSPVAR